MKKTLFLLLMLPIMAWAQESFVEFPTVDGKIKYVDIVGVPGKNKGLLFASAQAWMAQTFKKELNTTTVNDSDNGIVAGDLILGTTSNPEYKLTYTITCKDDKYRLEVENINKILDLSSIGGGKPVWSPLQKGYDFYLEKRAKNSKALPAWNKLYEKLDAQIKNELLASLKAAMIKKNDF